MLKTIIFYTVVIAAPLLTAAYFFLKITTVVLVHNTGTADMPLALIIDSATSYERTDDRLAEAGGIALLEFTPRTQGTLSITCKKEGQKQNFALGQASANTFFAAWVKMDSCERLVSKKVYSF